MASIAEIVGGLVNKAKVNFRRTDSGEYLKRELISSFTGIGFLAVPMLEFMLTRKIDSWPVAGGVIPAIVNTAVNKVRGERAAVDEAGEELRHRFGKGEDTLEVIADVAERHQRYLDVGDVVDLAGEVRE